MKKGYKQLLEEANAAVVTISPEEAMQLIGQDPYVFVDLRDRPELEREGMLPGAVHASRGMLEFLVDPESPYHNKVFSSGKQLVFYCASGGRSALAAKQAQEMGLHKVCHIGGGIKAWKAIGGAVAQVGATA